MNIIGVVVVMIVW